MLPFSYGLATVTYAHLAVQAKAVNSSLQASHPKNVTWPGVICEAQLMLEVFL